MIGLKSLPLKLRICLLFLIYGLAAGLPAQAEVKQAPDLIAGITKVAKAAIPAVVHVEVTQKSEVNNPLAQLENDPLMRRFFGLPKMPKKFKREMVGLGSGFLINPQGYILTNGHVVDNATKIQVLLADGREFTAKRVGIDMKTDLAVIKIVGNSPFPYLKFADSDKVEVGQWVVAIGHPRGLDQTVTQGIISAMHRTGISDPSSYQDFLQTDAAINPGNSGGPLLNLEGAVVGINSAIASASGGFEGIGFAIPSNMAFHITESLMVHGKVERGWLGVSVQELNYDRAHALGLATSKGALVTEVVQGGPAEKAGIQNGDVILDYNGAAVADSGELRNGVAITPIGKEVNITVWRKGQKLTLSARIGNLDEATKALASTVEKRIGAKLRPVTAKEAEKYGLEAPTGVAIASLSADSPLKKAGIEVNDIILGINGQMTADMDSFLSAMASIPPNRQVAFLVLDYRSGNAGAVKIGIK